MNLRTYKLWLVPSFPLVGAFFLFRFLHLPHAPFLNDEPRLLNAVEASYQSGFWPSVGPVGSQPIPYGPIPHWFYQLVRGISAVPSARSAILMRQGGKIGIRLFYVGESAEVNWEKVP
jgi:hypothetical protein